MSEAEQRRLEDHERRIKRLEEAPAYFLAIGGLWTLLWAYLGHVLHRVLT